MPGAKVNPLLPLPPLLLTKHLAFHSSSMLTPAKNLLYSLYLTSYVIHIYPHLSSRTYYPHLLNKRDDLE